MTNETRKIRRAIAGIEGAWVRRYKDGTVWAGARGQGHKGMVAVVAALEAAGHRCECNGAPGTAGQFIVDVLPGADTQESPGRAGWSRRRTAWGATEYRLLAQDRPRRWHVITVDSGDGTVIGTDGLTGYTRRFGSVEEATSYLAAIR